MKILYEGVDIYPDISVHRCYHDMYAEKQSDELLLKLNDTRELWDSWNPKKGDTIAIEDGAGCVQRGRARIDEMQEQKIPLKDEREFRERW